VAVKRGDVAIAVHGELGRPRPVVVVQADELGDLTTTVLVCPISSAVTDGLLVRTGVEPRAENGLRLRSQIMTDKMLALPRSHLRQVIGAIDSETSSRLDIALLLVLGLAR
jgi:mRNA interferase MazF